MEEAWKNFAATGKINDYLRFCEEREKRETEPDGNKPDSDGDGFECHADWRL